MGYQALLFCPDEKTVQLVTQVLTELDFAVEPNHEPFGAVKRLTTQHFDAIVVDCDNEQNAALLFKSARNSGPNKTSLAVAVVEGQGGIAKAFRIGANLVLTKPINVEQSKGTLRVARGLLKKPDTSKPATFEPPAVSRPAELSALRPLTPVPPKTITPPAQVPSTVLEVEEALAAQPEPTDAAMLESMPVPEPPKPLARPAAVKSAPWPQPKEGRPQIISTGASAAAAPAKESSLRGSGTLSPSAPAKERPISRPKPAAAPTHHAETHIPPPTFGGHQQASESGSKKWLVVVLVLVVAAAGGYFAWTKFGPHPTSTPVQTAPAPVAAVPALTTTQPATGASTPVPESTSTETAAPPVQQEEEVASDTTTRVTANSKPLPSVPAEKPHTSIVVKDSAKPAQPEVAPPVVAMDEGASNKDLSGIIGGGTVAKPVLRTLKISQGVSQGLVTKKVQPDYPMQARQLRIEGVVQLLATVSKEGNITDLKVLGGHPILARSATDAVKKWKYKPYTLNGQPIEFETQISVNFKLP